MGSDFHEMVAFVEKMIKIEADSKRFVLYLVGLDMLMYCKNIIYILCKRLGQRLSIHESVNFDDEP